MTTTHETDTTSAMRAANNNTKLEIVWEFDKGRVRNYTMHRLVPGIDPSHEGVTGDVDFGKREGLWRGYAVYDEEKKKFIFHRAYELLRTDTMTQKETRTG
jgi:hypothetical protein